MITLNHKPSFGLLTVAASTLFAVNIPVTHAAVITTGCALADTCTLKELYDGGSFTAGSKTFSAFSLIFEDSLGEDVDESLVTLTGLDDAGLVPGPGFRVDGKGELATPVGTFLGYVFEFVVTDSGSLIDGASLTAGATTLSSFDDLWSVQARLPNTNFFPDLEIVDGFGFPTVLSDSFDLVADAASIKIRNSITLDSFLGDTGAALSDYTFRLNQTAVPVPMALPLMLSGLGLLAGVARRRAR